jgi:hypothetical protein
MEGSMAEIGKPSTVAAAAFIIGGSGSAGADRSDGPDSVHDPKWMMAGDDIV